MTVSADLIWCNNQKDFFSVETKPDKNWVNYTRISLADFSHLVEIVRSRPWSPGVFSGGTTTYGKFVENYRSGITFVAASWLCLDIDDGLPLDKAVKIFSEYRHIIGTTKSHRQWKKPARPGAAAKPPMDRFRVLLKLDEMETDAKKYRAALRYLAAWVGADLAPATASGTFRPCVEIISTNPDGKNYSIPKIIGQSLPQEQTKNSGTPNWVLSYLRKGWVDSHDGSFDTTPWRMTKDLAKAGVSRIQAEALLRGSQVNKIDNVSKVIRAVYK